MAGTPILAAKFGLPIAPVEIHSRQHPNTQCPDAVYYSVDRREYLFVRRWDLRLMILLHAGGHNHLYTSVQSDQEVQASGGLLEF